MTNITKGLPQCLWLILPREIQEAILKFVDGIDLVHFAQTCRQFLQFDHNEMVWKQLFLQKFGKDYRYIKPSNADWKQWYFQNMSPRLFPLYGVTPGKTTVEELRRIAEPKFGNKAPYYIVRGIRFWYDEKSQVVTSLRLNSSRDQIPRLYLQAFVADFSFLFDIDSNTYTSYWFG
jgi:hypothetical protein